MTRRKLSALLLATGLVAACGGCGGGSNNSDNSANNPANNENNENNANNANNANNENNAGTAFWTATVTGLEEQDNMPLPAEGFGGDGIGLAGAKLLGNSDTEPSQTFTIELSSKADYDSTGDKEAGFLLSWGEPRIECISNLAEPFNPVLGGTLAITGTDPIKGTFTADLDCYVQTDAGANAVPAQLTGELEAFPTL